MTLDNLVNTIETVCLAHINVNTFSTGEAFEFAVDGDEIYVACHLLQPFVITDGEQEGSEIINFQLLILDKPDVAESQELELITKCKNIGDEIIYYLDNNYMADFQIVGQPVMTSVTEYSDNIDCGVIVEFTVQNRKAFNRCQVNDVFIF